MVENGHDNVRRHGSGNMRSVGILDACLISGVIHLGCVFSSQKRKNVAPGRPDEWAAEAFTKGLNPRSSDTSRKLKESLLEFQATTWADIHNRYESKIWIEDDQTEGRGRNFRAAKKFIADRGTDRGRKNRSLQDKETLGSRDASYPKLSEYNFNISIVELVSAMRNIKDARLSRPMRSDSIQRDPNLSCEYHGKNDHRTGDCRHLREEVATLLKNGHLREFLSDLAKNNYDRNRDDAGLSKVEEEPTRQKINMIFEGNEINGVTFSAAKKTKVSITHSKRLREDDITFTEEDANRLSLPHNDALVISLNVLDFKIKRVIVDPGSSANIIQ
ncbi:uncharacterized protein [Nicotiana tomentosiformis]|uniref:uncharacterized protein n=1 Tax=Nicotiana tomentosiformis TaxID=4098 RepID=UPI00388C8275